MQLYKLTDEMLKLYDSDAEDVALERVAKEIKVKAESIAKFIKNLDADAKMLGDEIKELQAKKKTTENKVVQIKKYVFDNLEALELKNIEAGIFKFSIIDVKSPVAEVENPEDLPKEYQKQTITANKTKIIEDYKTSGICPKGAVIKDGYSYLKLK